MKITIDPFYLLVILLLPLIGVAVFIRLAIHIVDWIDDEMERRESLR